MVAAVRVHQYGGPEVLTYEQVEVGAPGPGQIKLKQHASGVNYIDTYFRMGLYPSPVGLPFIAGNEGAGEVIAVGEGVTDINLVDALIMARYAARRPAGPPGPEADAAMELAELQVFLTVAAERSFSRAAAKLHRTQPAVSQAIRRLEEELGERLFDRSSKQGALTEAGPRPARLRAAADAPQRRGRDRRARAARPAPRTGADWRQRGRRARAAAADRRDSGTQHPEIQVDVRRVPSRQVGVEVVAREPGLRRGDVSAGRARTDDAGARARTIW